MGQLLAGDGYTADEVLTALQRSGRVLRFRFEWLDSLNASKGWLPNIQTGGSITHSANADIKRTLSITLLENLASGFEFSRDRIRPWVGVQMPDGGWRDWPQGVFLISTPERKSSSGLVTRDASGFDQTEVLITDPVTTTYSVVAGTAYTDAVTALLSGIPSVNLQDADATVPSTLFWDPGTSKLQIITDLLKAINYAPIWFDAFGVGQVQPRVDPGAAAVSMTYTNVGEAAMFTPEVSASLDLFRVPNYFIYVISQAGRPLLRSVFQNNDPASPVSVAARGRRIVQYVGDSDAPGQAELDAQARQAAIDAANVYELVTFSTPLMPVHEHRDVLRLTHPALQLSGTFEETDWQLQLAAGGTMSHTVRHVVQLDPNLIGTPTDTDNA